LGGELGFARFDGTVSFPVIDASGNPIHRVSGIVGTNAGDLWAEMQSAGLRMSRRRRSNERFADPRYRVRYNTFDSLDGVPGSPLQLRPLPSAPPDDGRSLVVP